MESDDAALQREKQWTRHPQTGTAETARQYAMFTQVNLRHINRFGYLRNY